MDQITAYDSDDDVVIQPTPIITEPVVNVEPAPVVVEPVDVEPIVVVPNPRPEETDQQREDRRDIVRYEKRRWFDRPWHLRGSTPLNNHYPIPLDFYDKKPRANKKSRK